MTETLKIQPHHLERGAYLYIRQSSMRQVIENVESTKRQYALRGRATALGWRDDQITIIDSDQGESGASASWREGFQRLMSDVGMGRVGVMGLEVSRLARNNADWHRLLWWRKKAKREELGSIRCGPEKPESGLLRAVV
jgi:DNA invertase Pin-like site-specific DNA recombinase